jgi:hypothetical protein
MTRAVTGVLVSLTIVCALASDASAATPPSLSTSFSPTTVSIGDTTQLTFTLSGGDEDLSDLTLDSRLPIGLNVTASSSPQCGGTLKTTPLARDTMFPYGNRVFGWKYQVALSGASLAAGGSCSFSVPVAVESAGQLNVNTWAQTPANDDGSGGYYDSTSSELTVPAIATPASVTTAFAPDTVPDDGTTTWTVQIANPNTSTTLTDVRFVADMPIWTASLSPRAITGDDCGGKPGFQEGVSPATITGPSVSYRGGSLAPGAHCRITVTQHVYWYPSFEQAPVGVTVISNEGAKSPVSTATLNKLDPPPTPDPGPTPVPDPAPTPTKPPSNAFTHAKPRIARDGTITETVKLPAKGTVRLRETWRGRLIAHTHRTVGASKKLTLKLVPGAATRRALASHRAARLKLSVAFTPAGGQTRTVKLTARTPR